LFCTSSPLLPMLSLVSASQLSFTPPASVVASRPAVRVSQPLMSEEAPSRREIFAKAGAALFSLSAVQSASAKAGQFSKQDIFSVVGTPAISSPYQPGGPKAGKDATFGYAKSDGPILATGYESDVTRELAAFKVSAGIVKSQAKNIESKTWWLVQDNLRGQAYNMKANMIAINQANGGKPEAKKAYAKFWKEIDSLDLACRQKELELAQKEYGDVLDALKEYEALL